MSKIRWLLGALLVASIGVVPILGSTCEVAGLRLTAERMAGRRHRIATVIIERIVTDEHAMMETAESGSAHE